MAMLKARNFDLNSGVLACMNDRAAKADQKQEKNHPLMLLSADSHLVDDLEWAQYDFW